MKEDAISKINKMGKAGSIITIILRIFVILGLVGSRVFSNITVQKHQFFSAQLSS